MSFWGEWDGESHQDLCFSTSEAERRTEVFEINLQCIMLEAVLQKLENTPFIPIHSKHLHLPSTKMHSKLSPKTVQLKYS